MITKQPNFLIILSAPSGGGKSTIVNRIRELYPKVEYSISYTTRQPRGEEENGVHYHFVSEAEFMERKQQGDFLEHAQVFGNWYGTSISYIQSQLQSGKHVIMDIDVQGAHQIGSTAVPCVRIFILPPSLEVLESRLRARGTDSPREIQKRLSEARAELKRLPEYQYLVINDELENAVQDVLNIIKAEENKMCRYKDPALTFLGENT
ncbi:MAG TPA: guanylate kinase [Candidatus Cloacimonetes bacterium]|nr:guanylate kinase [Candidatus Cloacimonas sp.]HHZ15277.1 guanylate kinase [Candidatus Cloacimonadota bacterium]